MKFLKKICGFNLKIFLKNTKKVYLDEIKKINVQNKKKKMQSNRKKIQLELEQANLEYKMILTQKIKDIATRTEPRAKSNYS